MVLLTPLVLSGLTFASTEGGETAPADTPKTVEAPAWVDVSALPAAHVVFADIPKQGKRRKVVRYAMRKDLTITGGSDWGRVLCFRFQAEPNLAVLETAARKAGLDATVREAANCQVPPAEAYLPPEPEHSVLVTFDPSHTIPAIRPELATLLDQDDVLSAVRVQDDAPGRICLEYAERQSDDAVQSLVSGLSFAIDTWEPVDDCDLAMADPPVGE